MKLSFEHYTRLANFELSGINNPFKYLGGLINQNYVRSGGGSTSKTYESVQGGEGTRMDEIERRHFLNVS